MNYFKLGKDEECSYKNPYYRKSVESLEIPWEETPDGTTHALWSESKSNWYYWKVENGETYFYRGKNAKWCRHHLQQLSLEKLQFAVERPKPRRNYGMNLRNVALLVRDDVTTIKVSFISNGMPENREYTYLLPDFLKGTEEGQMVLVCPNGVFKAAKVIQVDDETDVDPNSDIEYQWVIANLDDNLRDVEALNELTDKIQDKLKKQQASSLREQILRQFGIDSVAGLLGDKPEPE